MRKTFVGRVEAAGFVYQLPSAGLSSTSNSSTRVLNPVAELRRVLRSNHSEQLVGSKIEPIAPSGHHWRLNLSKLKISS
jgi:hypothetical protein